MVGVFLAIDLLVVPLSHALGHSLLSPLYTESSIKKDGAGTNETVSHTQSNVCIISAVDYNQLLFFVMANVFTPSDFSNWACTRLCRSKVELTCVKPSFNTC